jgi:mono/diheme cytochrome c family protein
MLSALPIVLVLVVTALGPNSASAQDAAAYFDENCASCHTIGDGELNGPDLKGVTQSRDREWIRRFITNPEAMVSAGDRTAVELLRKYDDALMPTPEGLTPHLLHELIEYLDRQSRASGEPAVSTPEPTFTAADAAAGEALFNGRVALSGGGAACSACHAVNPWGVLGGARLAPDLTSVHQRMQGYRGTTAWLNAPATPVMRRLFRDQPLSAEEVHALAAYFGQVGTSPPSAPRRFSPIFLLSGLFGAVLGLIAFDRTWQSRLSRNRPGRAGHRRGHA